MTLGRILDPIFYDLLDPSVRRIAITTTVKGKLISALHYERPFNQRYANYLLDTLLSIIRFGGQGFVKIARSAAVMQSLHISLVQRLGSGTCNQ
jgi:hypothetical protein